jgi:protein tyrosine phosphatase
MHGCHKIIFLGVEVTAGARIVRLYPDAVTIDQTVDTSAVYVDGFQQSNQFIAAQVPLCGAADQFWCMVKQNQVEKIIILNDAMPDEVKFCVSIDFAFFS